MTANDTLHHMYVSLRSYVARAISHIVPPKEVEDIVQETYLRAFQVKNSSDIQYPKSFLYRTARNLALDHVKRAETRLSDSMDEQVVEEWENTQLEDDTFARVVAKEEFSLFCSAVRTLPKKCRRAFVLKKVYGYTQKEIAKQLGISEGTVEKHIAQGIKKCTEFMLQYETHCLPESRDKEGCN